MKIRLRLVSRDSEFASRYGEEEDAQNYQQKLREQRQEADHLKSRFRFKNRNLDVVSI